jgi:hypothetical protein
MNSKDLEDVWLVATPDGLANFSRFAWRTDRVDIVPSFESVWRDLNRAGELPVLGTLLDSLGRIWYVVLQVKD